MTPEEILARLTEDAFKRPPRTHDPETTKALRKLEAGETVEFDFRINEDGHPQMRFTGGEWF